MYSECMLFITIGVIRCFAMTKTAERKFQDYCERFLEGYTVQMIGKKELLTLRGNVFLLIHAGVGRIGETVHELEDRFSEMDYLKRKKRNNIFA